MKVLKLIWDRYRRTPKALRWILWPVVLCVLAYHVEDWRGKAALSAYQARWRAAGLPLTWAEINQPRPDIAPERDIMRTPLLIDWVQAADPSDTRLNQTTCAMPFLSDPRGGRNPIPSHSGIRAPIFVNRKDSVQRSDDEQARHLLDTVFSPIEPLLREIAEALARPESSFQKPDDLEKLASSASLSSQYLNAARLFHLRCRIFLQLGESERAFADAITVLRAARVVIQPPVMLADEYCLETCLFLGGRMIWDGMDFQVWTPAQLTAFAKELDGLDPARTILQTFRGEAAYSQMIWPDRARRAAVLDAPDPLADLRTWISSSGKSGTWKLPEDWRDQLLKWTIKSMPDGSGSQMALADLRPLVEEILAPGGLLSPELHIEHLDRYLHRRDTAPFSLYDRAVREGTFMSVKIQGRMALHAQQRFDLARIAVAVERYHSEHQAYPANLTDLVPRYLPDIPEDRFVAGKPLRYRIVPNARFELYACGSNRLDEGGLAAVKADEGDVIWRFAPQPETR